MPLEPPSRKNIQGILLDLVNIINLAKLQKKQIGKLNTRTSPSVYATRGDSSVLFAYLLLSLFGQIDNINKVDQDSLIFFLEVGFKGIYLIKRNFTISYVVSEI